MNRQKNILIIGAAVIVVAGGVTAFALWTNNPPPPDPKTAKPEEVTRYVASEQFAKLPDEKKQAYAQEIFQNSNGNPHQMMRAAQDLPEKEREKLHENMRSVGMSMMRERINHFFELPPEQKTTYLDEMIDQQEHMRQQWQNHRPPDQNRTGDTGRDGGGGRRHWGPEHFKRMIESTPPADRARFMEFMKAMQKRRKERGLPEFPSPPRH